METKDVERLAQLAHLPLSVDEKVSIQRDLARVVAYVDELFAADVGDLPPMLRGPQVAPRVRDDVEQPVLGRAALEGNPGFDGALVRVPKVID